MRGLKVFSAIVGLLALSGCANREVYSVFGEEGEVFKGQMVGSSSSRGRIELDNARGTRCVGDYAGGASSGDITAGLVLGVLVGRPPTQGYSAPASTAGRALLTCSDGQQAMIQFTAVGSNSGYGFGQTDRGRPVKFTYGMAPDQAAQYIGAQPAVAGGGGGQSTGQPARRSSGTGFFITRQGHLLTNAHVVESCKTITVTSSGGAPVQATTLNSDKTNDLAVLTTGTPPRAIAQLRGSQPVRQGESVVAYGFPLSDRLSSGGVMTNGSVSALAGTRDDTRRLQISAPVQPGNSGGPLLDMTGAVVGVVTSRLRDPAGGVVSQNVNFAIKTEVVRTFLGAVGITPETSPGGRDLALPDIGDRARAFTVFIECGG